jgi:hypothetical protein
MARFDNEETNVSHVGRHQSNFEVENPVERKLWLIGNEKLSERSLKVAQDLDVTSRRYL